MTTHTDSILWYNVGIFGEAGFAVPNPSDDPQTLNDNIVDLVDLVGRNLFAIMKNEDRDLRTPPSRNTLQRVHQLYVRAGRILEGRAVPPGELQNEKTHVSPSRYGFRLYPVPYFKVRNPYLRRWCAITLDLIGEMMQHTENRKSVEITSAFAAVCGTYLKRIYHNMAIELFGKTREEVQADGFLLQDQDFAAYDPTKFFTGTELVDTVPEFQYVFTEDQLKPLSEGILVRDLPASVMPFPGSADEFVISETGEQPETSSADSGGSGPVFPPQPLG